MHRTKYIKTQFPLVLSSKAAGAKLWFVLSWDITILVRKLCLSYLHSNTNSRLHFYVRRTWRLLHRTTESSGGFQRGILTCSVEILWAKQGVMSKGRRPLPISWVSSGQSLGLQAWHPVLPGTKERGEPSSILVFIMRLPTPNPSCYLYIVYVYV